MNGWWGEKGKGEGKRRVKYSNDDESLCDFSLLFVSLFCLVLLGGGGGGGVGGGKEK